MVPTMNAKACLSRAQRALDAKDLTACRAELDAYRTWRRSGGAEPLDGDACADDIAEALDSEIEARAASFYADPDSQREGDL